MGRPLRLAVLVLVLAAVVATLCDAKRRHRGRDGADQHSGGNSIHDGSNKDNQLSRGQDHGHSEGPVIGEVPSDNHGRRSNRRRNRNRKTSSTTAKPEAVTTGTYVPYLGE